VFLIQTNNGHPNYFFPLDPGHTGVTTNISQKKFTHPSSQKNPHWHTFKSI
jgi:hypothetical protein